MSMAWEPDRRSNFFFIPPAHLCAVTYMTEISLIVTLSNQFTLPYLTKDFPSRTYRRHCFLFGQVIEYARAVHRLCKSKLPRSPEVDNTGRKTVSRVAFTYMILVSSIGGWTNGTIRNNITLLL